MAIVDLIILLAIGAAAGWLAGNLMSGGGFGLIGNIVVGIVGSFIGSFLGNVLLGGMNLNMPSWLSTLILSTIGAVVLLFIVKLVKRA
ncbi:MAG: GlsB/YeaQ/YmgE family stress response membrane protein [Thiothrix sp.]|nr:GlsB/YeaQ/YmgE family stress response membrane protein [Thiothrix sp.]HPE61255.1 GlsB/YeaQ/YmgE family stress response membrane protein [Thiolinea sp.]HPQ95032.1 GlsB/YeaQ/YmgE family stress response membrane protein [Thiolinea sp.]